MYVLVRKELDPTYRCVQGAHALAGFAKTWPEEFTIWNNEYLIFVTTRFHTGIINWKQKLTDLGIRHFRFYEPDLQAPTAIACYCEPSVFKDLPLA